MLPHESSRISEFCGEFELSSVGSWEPWRVCELGNSRMSLAEGRGWARGRESPWHAPTALSVRESRLLQFWGWGGVQKEVMGRDGVFSHFFLVAAELWSGVPWSAERAAHGGLSKLSPVGHSAANECPPLPKSQQCRKLGCV